MEDNSNVVKIVLVVFFFIFGIQLLPFIIMILPGLKLNGWVIFGIIVGITIIWAVSTYNKFVSLSQRVRQAQGGIDVYLKQRFDLIPNLVETVKGYKEYEAEILANITKLRMDYENRNDQDIKQSEALNDRYTRLLAVIENYPELKANESFLKLQKTLSKLESQLQAARRIYNSEVTEYNTKRYKFPSNVIGAIFGFKEKSLFQIADAERQNIDINM